MSFFRDLPANPFLLHGLFAGLLASLACGLIGPYVVSRRLVLLGGAIAHVAVGGLGAAIFVQQAMSPRLSWLQPLHGATLAAVLAALLLARVCTSRSGLPVQRSIDEDTLVGALWAVGMSSGILLSKLTPGYQAELLGYLFGNLSYVGRHDLWLLVALDALIVIAVFFFHKRFYSLCLDPQLLRLQGVSPRATSAVLLVLVALTVIVLTRVVGLILVIALLTLPAATAACWARRLPAVMFLATGLCALLTTLPRILAYGSPISPEPAIVLSAGLTFLLVALFRRKHLSG